MRSRVVAVLAALSGWFIAGSYLCYESSKYQGGVASHLAETADFRTALFHILVFSAPFVSTAAGYLLFERGKLLLAAEEKERLYRDYYENAPHGYISMSEDMTILNANAAWLGMLGYGKDEAVGRLKLTDILTDEGVELMNRVYASFVKKGVMENIEVNLKRKDGSFMPVSLSSTAVFAPDGRFMRSRSIVKDNTDKRNFESALKMVADEWRHTFDSMPWGVLLLDSQWNVIKTNEYFSALSGISAYELAVTKCYELIQIIDKADKSPISKAVGEDNARALEYQDPVTGRFLRLYGRPVITKGILTNYVFSIVDVSDIRTGEKKLLNSRDAFFNMLKDLSAAYKGLNELYEGLVIAFANAIDAKSPWTKGHSERVSRYAIALAKEMGSGESELNKLRIAALLHDIGKIGTYDYLLDKPEKLTREEYEVVKLHPVRSATILQPIVQFADIIDIVKYHHEQYDGNGYPDGLKGEDIPYMARILCVADSYDSMIADRPYRPATNVDDALSELNRCSGTHFDPAMVDAFVRVIRNERPAVK